LQDGIVATAERIDKVYDFTTTERGLPQGRFNSYTDMLKKFIWDKQLRRTLRTLPDKLILH
jgi:hypothetical protein